MLLEPEGGRRHVTMSEYEPNRGRRLQSSSHSRDTATAAAQFGSMLDDAQPIYVSPTFSRSMLLHNRPECISISQVDQSLLGSLQSIVESLGMLMVSLEWLPTNALAGQYLWRSLILTRVVASGLILADFEEFPLNEIFDEEGLRWRRSRDPWPPADGFFFSYEDDVYPEQLFEQLAIPPDLVLPSPAMSLRSPIERVLGRVGSSPVHRISSRDDPMRPGTYVTPYPHLQYPDVARVTQKVRDYCLRRGHPERKWEGFAAHGWDGTHPTHAIKLASLLSSALLLPFEPLDPRVTADGAIQFGAMIAVPSFRHGYAPVMTAWVATPGAPIQLASAFVVSSNDVALDPTLAFTPHEAVDWHEIVRAAIEFGDEAVYDGVTAQARVFVSRQGRGKELSRALVASGQSHGDFRRAPLGGRCVLSPIGGGQGWVQAGRTSAYAQVALGLRGVLSLQAPWID